MAKLAGARAGAPVRSAAQEVRGPGRGVVGAGTPGVVGVVDEVCPASPDAARVGGHLPGAGHARTGSWRRARSAAFADWWATTAGAALGEDCRPPRWITAGSGRRWTASARPTDARSRPRLGGGWSTEFGLDLSGLVLDMTNFATFIDSANERAPIAQRGKAKQKRTDLRLVGLAPGRHPRRRDPAGVARLRRGPPGRHPVRHRASTNSSPATAPWPHEVESLTVVYDAGQNSADNHAQIEAAGIGFVGSLPPSDHPDLLAIARDPLPRRGRRPVPRPDRTCDTTVTALGVTRRAVLTHSTDPARRPVPRLRPDPGQGPRRAGRPAGTPGPRQDPPRPRPPCEAEIAADLQTPLGRRGHHRHPHRRRPRPSCG